MNGKIKKLIVGILFVAILSAVSVFCVSCGDNDKREETPVQTNTFTYTAGEHGRIIGETVQTVKLGEYGTPVTAVGDDGYKFYRWDNVFEGATRRDYNEGFDRNYTASFRKAGKVKYLATDAGYIEGEAEQLVISYLEMTSEVTAVPNEGYEFYCWSDGVKTATRSDPCFESYFEVTALFKIKEYKVRYILQEGGYFVEGEEELSVPHGSYSPPIVIAELPYYKFLGWSDGVTTLFRQEKITADLEVTALFEPLEVPVEYGVYKGGKIVGSTSQSIVCGGDATEVTAIPDEGYEFLGWTDGVKTATRRDTEIKHNIRVKANFAPIDAVKYKVLMVFVTKLKAELRSNLITGDKEKFETVTVDYTMSETEWQIYDRLTINVGECINDMFEGKVWFVFESYFTNETVNEDSMREGWDGRWLTYDCEPSWIPELEDSGILREYDTVMTTFGMNDYDFNLQVAAGSAGRKFGYIHTETLTASFVINDDDPALLLDEIKYKAWWDSFNETYLHELTHTCELWVKAESGDLHGTIGFYCDTYGMDPGDIEIVRLYLLREAVVNGVEWGIPPSYWEYNATRRQYTIPRIPSRQ